MRRILTVVGALACFLIALAPSSSAAAAPTPVERMKKAALGELRDSRRCRCDRRRRRSRAPAGPVDRAVVSVRDAINANKSTCSPGRCCDC